MNGISLPERAIDVLLEDAIQRDRSMARRYCLLKILWHERCLTREQLVARVEGELGKGIFGRAAWQDNFFRDMRLVKSAFSSSGHSLVYRRNPKQPGYMLLNQPLISSERARMLEGSVMEVDARQISVTRRLSAAERFRMGCSISDASLSAVAYRIRQRNPSLDPLEATRIALLKGQER